MTSRIILNAFDMTCVTHQNPGLWRHPDNRADRYNTLEYWTDLARTLERGRFDAVFIADVVGLYDVYRGTAAASFLDADQVPVNDPLLQVPAMAAVTERLGFGVTVAVTYEQPYLLARRFSTLDHLTGGRIGINVVTSYLDSAARNLGLRQQVDHDRRYDLADEFLDVVYKLWEGSWEDGAVVKDPERGVYTDPAKVHPIGHSGEFYEVPGIHLTEPSPQRTPVIYQAGASSRGRDFASKHGEALFIIATSPEQARGITDDIRDRAEAQGRRRDSVKILTLLTVITGATDEEAQATYDELAAHASLEGGLALAGGWTGIDFSTLDPDVPLEYVDNDSLRSVLAMFTTADPTRRWTPRDVAGYLAIGGLGKVVVGGPETVADELERWIEVGGLDGFNLAYAITPGTFEDFVDHVVPELQRRGRVWQDYPVESDGTLRSHLLDAPTGLVPDEHPAAQYRGAFVDGASAADGTSPSPFSDARDPLAAPPRADSLVNP